ncbi:DUF4129 domain-containing protein [Brevibacterium antiquum]|uniref:Protein-glutamine gamma-glutamyltransferase-like C-terminal domain-containing protein n=1 Tax=Brevibacterium antiquum CNRZ 918 TaxID=1255637 RepID=A0A2H1JNT9_9MICO|nr:hypothetical protein [Brevibacterium antiquum]SMX89004.1 protein of unknown function (DUF4129) [Brevibacterium antiquum CNRZ 918]
MSMLGSSTIDRETGREWVEGELSKKEYSDTDLTPLEQLGQWLSNIWDSIVSSALQGNSPWLILIVVVALAAIVGLIIWRVRRVGLRKTSLPLSAFDPVVASPEPGPWRDSALAAAERGDMMTAVIDSARAIFAVLSQKQIITLDSASTASELSRTAGGELPEHRQELARVANAFNDLLFGADPAQTSIASLNATYSEFLALDESLSALTPRHRSAVAS